MSDAYHDSESLPAAAASGEVPSGIAAARAAWQQSAIYWKYAWLIVPAIAAAGIGLAAIFSEVVAITIAVISGVIFIIMIVAYFDWRGQRERAFNLMEMAQIMGFTYTGEMAKKDFDQRFGVFALINSGHSHQIKNIVEGSIGDWQIVLLDWRYTVGSGKSARHHAHTQAMIPETAGVPTFQLSPESFFHKIGQLFGMADINFDEAPKFSKAYHLRGPDEAAIRAAFTPAVREFIEQEKSWNIESRGDWLLVFRTDKILDPDKYPEFAADALRLVSLFQVTESTGDPSARPSEPTM